MVTTMFKQMVEQAQLGTTALVAVRALRPMAEQAQLVDLVLTTILVLRPELSREEVLQGAKRLSQTSTTDNTVQILVDGRSLALMGKPLPWE